MTAEHSRKQLSYNNNHTFSGEEHGLKEQCQKAPVPSRNAHSGTIRGVNCDRVKGNTQH